MELAQTNIVSTAKLRVLIQPDPEAEMRVLRNWRLLVAPLIVAPCVGCALVAIGAGGAAGYAYAAGKEEKVYPYPVEETVAAVREAMQEMQLRLESDRADALCARFESHLATGEKVAIKVEAKGQGLTEVGIRIGVFGDHLATRMLFEKIDARLPGPYPPTSPPLETHIGLSISR